MNRRGFLSMIPLAAVAAATETKASKPTMPNVVTADGESVEVLGCTNLSDGTTSQIIVTLDGKRIAESVVPHIPGAIRRHGLV